MPALFTAATIGCASQVLRVSDRLYETNPIERVMIVGAATVEWPGYKGEPRGAIGITESKQVLATQLPVVERMLRDRGYEIVGNAPVAVGVPNSRTVMLTPLVLVTDARGFEVSTRRTSGRAPAYRYELPASLEAIRAPSEQVFADNQLFGSRSEPSRASKNTSFRSPPSSTAVIGDASGADTICFVHIRGAMVTKGQVIGDVLRSGALVASVDAEYFHLLHLTVVDAATGQVYFQQEHFSPIMPTSADDSVSRKVLHYFPKRGAALSSGISAQWPVPWRDVARTPKSESAPEPERTAVIGIVITEASSGVQIQRVVPGASADAAGLRVGDLILSIDGRRVTSKEGFGRITGSRQAGDVVVVHVERDRKRFDVDLQLLARSQVELRTRTATAAGHQQ